MFDLMCVSSLPNAGTNSAWKVLFQLYRMKTEAQKRVKIWPDVWAFKKTNKQKSMLDL